MSVRLESLAGTAVEAHRAGLVALLRDAVDSGASVGFLPPLDAQEAGAYWESVAAAVQGGSRLLLAALNEAGSVIGSAQLELATPPNGRHRAEVTKVMVQRAARRHGTGRALMLAIEDRARQLGRTTLVLDTRTGDPSERLYRSVGWQLAGTIPRYARSAGGGLEPTSIYYRLLAPA